MIHAINTNTTTQTSSPAKPVKAATAAKSSVQMPTSDRNYCIFDEKRVNKIASQKEKSLPYIKKILQTSKDEKEIVEALYILDRMIGNSTKGIPAMYPILAKFNNTSSPNIQAYLAGVYRKIQVPDAFGPLLAMLIRNTISINQNDQSQCSDPNEEIGGAILAYIENYSNHPKKIDYSA